MNITRLSFLSPQYSYIVNSFSLVHTKKLVPFIFRFHSSKGEARRRKGNGGLKIHSSSVNTNTWQANIHKDHKAHNRPSWLDINLRNCQFHGLNIWYQTQSHNTHVKACVPRNNWKPTLLLTEVASVPVDPANFFGDSVTCLLHRLMIDELLVFLLGCTLIFIHNSRVNWKQQMPIFSEWGRCAYVIVYRNLPPSQSFWWYCWVARQNGFHWTLDSMM